MNLPFVKMQAQGNDFVILDGVSDVLPQLTQVLIQNICDRHFGIGCDQLLVLQSHNQADVMMLIYNADGSQAANCGNGLRCVGDLLMHKLSKNKVSIALADRIVEAERMGKDVRVVMGAATIEHVTGAYTDVLIGNRHRVHFTEPQVCLERNVEIIETYDAYHADIRIIERGVGETLACGSGACAVAIAVWNKTSTSEPVTIKMPGGSVVVSKKDNMYSLSGTVSTVFKGIYNVVDK